MERNFEDVREKFKNLEKLEELLDNVNRVISITDNRDTLYQLANGRHGLIATFVNGQRFYEFIEFEIDQLKRELMGITHENANQ